MNLFFYLQSSHKNSNREGTKSVFHHFCFGLPVSLHILSYSIVRYVVLDCFCPWVRGGCIACLKCACAILLSVACLAVHFFFHIISNCTIFEKKSYLVMKYMFWFSHQILYDTFLILRRIERDVIKNVYWSSCKVTDILVRFLWNLNLLNRFSKKYSDIKFRENPSSVIRVITWGQTDGRHDG